MSEIHIIGAGLTGMSAAHHLRSPYTIHERSDHVGGHVVTVEDNGYRFDRTGHLLHLRDADMRAWVLKMLGADVVHVKRQSMVFSHGRYTRYPYQANTFGLPPEVAYECLIGFLQRDTSIEPKDFEDFCLKHFGEGFSKHFMVPYNEKLWGVSLKEITPAWCSRFVPMPKLADVVAGAVGLNDRELGYNTHFVYPTRGIEALSIALSRGLEPHLRLNHAPDAIDWKKGELVFGGNRQAYRALIATLPLDKLIDLLFEPPEPVRAAREKLRCNSLRYLDVALRSPCRLPYHWVYVPERKYPFYRVGCYSNFSSDMAPAGCAGLYVELSSRAEPDMASLESEVARALVEMQLIGDIKDVYFMRSRLMEHAYVVFDHNYYGALEVIEPFLKENRMINAGRYGGWNYSSMEDALLFGKAAAARAEAYADAVSNVQ